MCLHPLMAVRYYDMRENSYYVQVSKRGNDIAILGKEAFSLLGEQPKFIYIPCGRCVECERAKAREWAFRVCDEVKEYGEENCCMINLTYNEENCPPELSRRDVQLFIKRLRKKVGAGLKIFYCGEYGERHGRPHYHIIVLGYRPSDLIEWSRSERGEVLYRSRAVEQLWTLGFSLVGIDMSERAVLYCCKYLQKTQYTDQDTVKNELWSSRVKPFIGMSKGIGERAVNSLTREQVRNDTVYRHGKAVRLPRYYIDKAEKLGYTEEIEQLKARRMRVAEEHPQDELSNEIREEHIRKAFRRSKR